MGGGHLPDAAAAHFVELVPGHIYVAAQQMVGPVVRHHQLEQTLDQPVYEPAQYALQHLLQRPWQVCGRPFGVQAATILPQGLLHKLVAGGAIIQLVKCVYFLPHFV